MQPPLPDHHQEDGADTGHEDVVEAAEEQSRRGPGGDRHAVGDRQDSEQPLERPHPAGDEADPGDDEAEREDERGGDEAGRGDVHALLGRAP